MKMIKNEMKQKVNHYSILDFEMVCWKNAAQLIIPVVRRDNHITYFINTILTKITGN